MIEAVRMVGRKRIESHLNPASRVSATLIFFPPKVLTEFLRNTYNELLCEAPTSHPEMLIRTY
jgi:hypothetical protein